MESRRETVFIRNLLQLCKFNQTLCLEIDSSLILKCHNQEHFKDHLKHVTCKKKSKDLNILKQ